LTGRPAEERLEALEFINEVLRPLDAAESFGGRVRRLATALVPRLGEGCRVEATDADGRALTAEAGAPGPEVLTLPLTAHGRSFGTIRLSAARAYGEAERALAEDVAARAAVRLEAARLLEGEHRARQRIEALQAVTSALSGAVTPEQVGQAIAEQGARALAGSGAAVYALAPDAATLRVIGTWGYSEDAVGPFLEIAADAAVPLAEAAREGRVVTADSPAELAARYPELPAEHSLCAAPLLAGDEGLGAVGISRDEMRPFAPADRALLEALGRQGGLALERARLYRRQQRANDRLHRLQATTAALARALTPGEVAATAAQQGADALGAATAWVALMDRSGRALELAHSSGHPVQTLERFRLLPIDAELPLAHAARTLTPLWLESAREIFGRFPRFAEVRPQAQAAALLPLVADGAAVGAIGLVFDEPHAFGPGDRDYLLALTRLCGQALGRARRYQTEHDVASTLQQALLPEELPPADGLELAVRYLPAAAGTEAGGDFYEAIELPAGRLGLAVGDVVGHGPAAAAAMGQLRSALRAYALEGRPPARVLQLLGRYADGVMGARGATVVYAVLDPPSGELRYACAGHPPPLVLTAGGETRFLSGGRGVPLDRTLTYRYQEAVARLEPGATLVLYSDGAVERRGESLDVGLERLATAASAAAGSVPEVLCARLLDALFADVAPRDDVALLAARLGRPAVAPLRLRLPAEATQLRGMRAALRAWLAGAGVGPGDGELVVLAAGELAANSIEHAYAPGEPGEVEVELSRDREGTLTLLVRDAGRWRPPPADPGERGRGLAIVRALMHAVDVDDGASGSSVSARFQPGPAGGGRALAGDDGTAAVAVERVGATLVARVSGELDMAVAPDVGAQLQGLGPGPLVVDLSGVGFLGSAGLRVLFALAGLSGGVAVVAPPEAPCRRSIEVAELQRALPVVETVEEALGALRGSP
jgi:anti-anti-sigma factor